jgi:hypothetical protein
VPFPEHATSEGQDTRLGKKGDAGEIDGIGKASIQKEQVSHQINVSRDEGWLDAPFFQRHERSHPERPTERQQSLRWAIQPSYAIALLCLVIVSTFLIARHSRSLESPVASTSANTPLDEKKLYWDIENAMTLAREDAERDLGPYDPTEQFQKSIDDWHMAWSKARETRFAAVEQTHRVSRNMLLQTFEKGMRLNWPHAVAASKARNEHDPPRISVLDAPLSQQKRIYRDVAWAQQNCDNFASMLAALSIDKGVEEEEAWKQVRSPYAKLRIFMFQMLAALYKISLQDVVKVYERGASEKWPVVQDMLDITKFDSNTSKDLPLSVCSYLDIQIGNEFYVVTDPAKRHAEIEVGWPQLAARFDFARDKSDEILLSLEWSGVNLHFDHPVKIRVLGLYATQGRINDWRKIHPGIQDVPIPLKTEMAVCEAEVLEGAWTGRRVLVSPNHLYTPTVQPGGR